MIHGHIVKPVAVLGVAVIGAGAGLVALIADVAMTAPATIDHSTADGLTAGLVSALIAACTVLIRNGQTPRHVVTSEFETLRTSLAAIEKKAAENAAHAAEHREALARWSGAIEERQNTSGEDRKSIKEGLSEIREDVSEIKARVSSIEGNCKVHSAILAAKQGANA